MSAISYALVPQQVLPGPVAQNMDNPAQTTCQKLATCCTATGNCLRQTQLACMNTCLPPISNEGLHLINFSRINLHYARLGLMATQMTMINCMRWAVRDDEDFYCLRHIFCTCDD